MHFVVTYGCSKAKCICSTRSRKRFSLNFVETSLPILYFIFILYVSLIDSDMDSEWIHKIVNILEMEILNVAVVSR